MAGPVIAEAAGTRILVIEDEISIADFIHRGLQAQGFDVRSVFEGIEGERRALSGEADLVILDRMLPGRDGLDILIAIRRRRPYLPVIMLTAKAEIGDRVAGLDAGATDYLVKPFAFAELSARVRARLRKGANVEATTLAGAGIELDLLSRKARRHGCDVVLTAREFDLLAHFLRHPGLTLSRREILTAVWGYEHDPRTNIVEVYVRYLRRKLDQPGRATPIVTVRSAGYRLDDGA